VSDIQRTLFAKLGVSQFGSVWRAVLMGTTTGFTTEEIRELVHEYQLQPWGTNRRGWTGGESRMTRSGGGGTGSSTEISNAACFRGRLSL